MLTRVAAKQPAPCRILYCFLADVKKGIVTLIFHRKPLQPVPAQESGRLHGPKFKLINHGPFVTDSRRQNILGLPFHTSLSLLMSELTNVTRI
jgi:hypothetical protein